MVAASTGTVHWFLPRASLSQARLLWATTSAGVNLSVIGPLDRRAGGQGSPEHILSGKASPNLDDGALDPKVKSR
jgi:hypothetical protein